MTNPVEQQIAFLAAHRIVLTYLVRAVRQALPAEADPKMIDATLTWLRNSVPPVLSGLPPDIAARVESLAGDEIDRIFMARDLPAPTATPEF